MKNIFRILQLSAVILASVGCTETMVDEPIGAGDVESGYATLTLSGAVKSRAIFDYDAASYKLTPSWEVGDRITIFDKNKVFLAHFLLSGEAGVSSAEFTAESIFDLLEGDEYNIIYPAVDDEIYPESFEMDDSTQSISGDADHLDDNLVFTAKFNYNNPDEVIFLTSEQCVVEVNVVNLGDWEVNSVSYTIGEQSAVKVSLETTASNEAVIFIPSNPQLINQNVSFTVTYDGDKTKSFTGLSNSVAHLAAGVYTTYLNMDNADSETNIEILPSGASGETEIIIPLGLSIESAGTASDYPISVTNGGETLITPITIKSVDKDSDGKSLKLTLSDKIYSDDTVSISYNGTSTTVGYDGATNLQNFENISFSPAPTDITDSSYLTVHTFEDGGTYNTFSNHRAFYLSTDDNNGGTESLRYSYDYSYANTTVTGSSQKGSYYVGINAEPVPITTGDTYVVVFDFKAIELTDGLTNKFNLRVRAPKNTGTGNGESTQAIDFGTPTLNTWCEIATEITIAESATAGYVTGDSYNSHVSFVTISNGTVANPSGCYVTPVDAEFYIDNIRVYEKSDMYRPTQSSGGVGVGDLREEEF